MNESSPDSPETEPPIVEETPDRRARWRRVWWWLRAVLLVLAAPILMVVVAGILLIGHEVTAPSWIVRDVEARAAEVLAGGALEFGELKVTVGDDLHPRLVLNNAVLRDADGAVLARVPRIESLVSPRGALQGRFLPQEIRLRGAQISLSRSVDGTVALAFDQGAAAVGAAPGFIGLLDEIDQAFEAKPLEALEQVRAEGLIINYVDARARRSWVIDDGRIGLDLRGGDLALRADVALLSGRAYVTTAEMTYRSPRGSRSGELGLAITDAAAPDIASQSPLLAWLGVLDAPISGAVRGRLDEAGALVSASATLQIGAGELQPTAETRPIPFDGARTYLRYVPAEDKLVFNLLEIDSALGRVSGSAKTYLGEYENGWPNALLGQVAFTEMSVAAGELYEDPVSVADGNVDFRLRLDPFTLDIGQATAVTGDVPVHVRGQVLAATDGWSVALDAHAEEITTGQVLALWPPAAFPKTRDWIEQNVIEGTLLGPEVAFRARPDHAPTFAMTLDYSDAEIRFLRNLPPIEGARGRLSLVDRRFALSVDEGYVAAPEGGRITMGGSSMVIPQTGPRAPARFELALRSRITAAMSLLRRPPFNVLRSSDLPVSLAQGDALIDVVVETPLGRDVAPDERVWSASAELRNIRSEVLVPGRVFTASNARLRVDPESLVIQGAMALDGLRGDAVFSRAIGAGSEGTARISATLPLSAEALRTFNVTLPNGMITGGGTSEIEVDLSDVAAPTFRLTSDLRGVGMSLAELGWSKARSASGELVVTGALGATPSIDRLSITAPGLSAAGTVQIAAGGGLERAAFERVRLGGWLDAPVVLLGRGAGRPAEVQIAGGTLDLRGANFGGGGGGSGNGGGAGSPMDIALDRLQITDEIALENFRGQFTSPSGLQGEFQGDVNGIAPVQGTLVTINGRAGVRIMAPDGGAVVRAAGLLRNAQGGTMQLTLLPAQAEGEYDGTLTGRNLRVRDAPALASLLDAISVVGLLTQLDGQGLLFTDVEAAFRLTPSQIVITRSSAVGPGLGLSLDGVYRQSDQRMDLQGVVSPFYLLNGIGAVLTRPGEGLIGFNFNLRGSVDNPQVLVNPLSALTPGMFREIFRRPPPRVQQ